MKINNLIKEFIFAKSQEVKQGTLDNYIHHFKHFIKFTNQIGLTSVEDLTDEIFYEYLILQQKTCVNRTLNIRFGNLQRLFRDMHIQSNFLETYKKRKEKYTTYDMVDFNALKIIRDYLYNLPKTDQNDYHAAIILILMETGVRANELIHIEKKHVSLKMREIKLVTTKTDETRTVYFREKTVPLIKRLLNTHHDHKYFFHNPDKNRPITFQDLRYITRKIKETFELEKFHPHMLRHSFVTKLTEEKIPDKVIMSMTGHKNANTLHRYSHVRKYKVKMMFDDALNYD